MENSLSFLKQKPSCPHRFKILEDRPSILSDHTVVLTWQVFIGHPSKGTGTLLVRDYNDAGLEKSVIRSSGTRKVDFPAGFS